jgi:hypothetical protein
MTSWVVMILLFAVAYLYYENKDLRRSKNEMIDYLRAKHETEIKKLIENKKDPLKNQSDSQPKNESQASYIDCDFDDKTPF